MRAWTEPETEYVCDHYGIDLSVKQIAADLGRTKSSLCSWLERSGIPLRRRQFSAAERRYVREHYRKTPSPAIASHLGRSLSAVYQVAVRLGLARKGHRMTAEGQQVLRQLAAEGACNRCIGRAINLGRKEVRRWRHKLGLPRLTSGGAVDSCQTCKERTRSTTQRQLERAGVASLAEVRVQAFQDYARRHGWPEDLRPRAVQILDVLHSRGPQTRRQLAELVGMPWKGSRKSLVSNDPEGSYLAHLMARGLVVCLGRAVKGKGRGHSVCLYSLSLSVQKGSAS